MPLTITITDPLAIKLQSEAASRKISAEQFALEVLGQAVHSDDWATANQRRLELVRSQFAGGLTPVEAAELQELQCRVDRQLESLDSPDARRRCRDGIKPSASISRFFLTVPFRGLPPRAVS
jgi:hypothetical protein